MVAITFRMAAGVPGDVNRAHPFSISPALPLAVTPPTLYGQPVIMDAGGAGVRPIVAGDSAIVDIWGITVRPYPLQPASATNYGAVALTDAAVPPTNQVIDLLQSGFIFVKVNGSPVAGARVHIYYGVNSGAHVQGGFEAAAGANILDLGDRYYYNGGPDANGVCELRCNA